MGLLNNKNYSHCHGPNGTRHCIFYCWISQQIWQIIAKLPLFSLTSEYLPFNKHLNMNEISQVNYYLRLKCIIYTSSRRVALIQYSDEPQHLISPATTRATSTNINTCRSKKISLFSFFVIFL